MRIFRILLVGNPNSGKTTLFNLLTGLRARTGNYPGITVECRAARIEIDGILVELIDLPGTYSLSARSEEERIAIREILKNTPPSPDLALVIADATALERHLYLLVQVLETGLPSILCLNMMDEARAQGLKIDLATLEKSLGIPVVAIAARHGEGLEGLKQAIASSIRLGLPVPKDPPLTLHPRLEQALDRIEKAIDASLLPQRAGRARRALARWLLLSVGEDELSEIPPTLRALVASEEKQAFEDGLALDHALISARYAWIDTILKQALAPPSFHSSTTERIDRFLTHPLWGSLAFMTAMFFLFQMLFKGVEPIVSIIETLVSLTQSWLRHILPPGPLVELLANGVVAGVGNVLVFLPQIAFLSFFLAFLEDTGYLARVAFVIDRLMGAIGLHGRAFIPMLSGFACAVPAILSTRTIENRRDRLLVMLTIPLVSCSARLPVYLLVIGILFPPGTSVFGLEAGALLLFGMYALSILSALGAAYLLRHFLLRGPRPPFLLELPPYRWPDLRNLLRVVFDRSWAFVSNAGSLITAITVVLWALLHLPWNAERERWFEQRLAEAKVISDPFLRSERIDQLVRERAEERMESSFAGRLGQMIEPLIAPLGFDWKIGIGILASFAAREVLVSTLGIVYGAGEEAEAKDIQGRIRQSKRKDGRPALSALSGISLMVFYLFAAQCMSTVIMVFRESGSWRWALLMVAYMNSAAYLASLLVYQGGKLLGFE
ncbi:MAG: ferrous iron transport protein B [Sandaracinaceae bacterium]|nr:ferrous iron transport protein B [Sandaracinaceae bacterium]